MPRMDEPEAQGPIKAVVIGNSGSGKTGALASLASAGYQLHIADFDKGTSIIRNVLVQQGDKTALKNVEFETFTDEYKIVGSSAVPKSAKAWSAGIKKIDQWANEYQSQDHIIVVDSLNFATKAAFNWVLQAVNRLTPRLVSVAGGGNMMMSKEQSDWGAAQDLVESFLMKLYADDVKCHVIVTSHIEWLNQGEDDTAMGFPKVAVGKKFAPSVGRYFNSTLLCRNQNGVRQIWTESVDNVDLKTESLNVKKFYPLKSGLADFFKDVRGTTPSAQAQKPAA